MDNACARQATLHELPQDVQSLDVASCVGDLPSGCSYGWKTHSKHKFNGESESQKHTIVEMDILTNSF